MICNTVKSGFDCVFMTKKGCSYVSCKVVVEQCEGCGKVFEYESGKYCKVYPDPQGKWMSGGCPTATHIKLEIKEAQKINPLKASKKASKKA